MRRREFVHRMGLGALALSPGLAGIRLPRGAAPWLLVPMDDAQSDHLKAYGLAFRVLERGDRAEWLLNYRGGSFLVPADAATIRDAALAGVTTEPLDDGAGRQIRGEIQGGNMDAVPLEKVAQGGGVRAAQRGALGRRGHHGAQLRRHQVREDLGRGGAGARSSRTTTGSISTTRTSPGSTRSSSSTTPARPGWWRWWSGTGRWRGSSASPRCRRRSARWRPRSRGTSSAAASSSRCAPRPRRSTWRSRAMGWTSRRATPTERRWIPTPSAKMHWDQALAFQDARSS